MMKEITFLHYEAFADRPEMGNPAGIVFDTEGRLTEQEMQRIAAVIGFSETAFVLPPSQSEADLRLRFFTPGNELPLCGHATVATASAIAAREGFSGDRRLLIETGAGMLPVDWLHASGEVVMKQNDAQFRPYDGDLAALLAVIGLTVSDLDNRYPVVYGSTGSWTLIVPLHSLAACAAATPQNKRFPSVLAELPSASIHPLVCDVIRPGRSLHGRHFSGAYAGTAEDPVTGTASGVMGGYYLRYLEPTLASADLLIEQGQEIGRDGEVRVWAERKPDGEIAVSIGGRAICCKTAVVSY